MGADYWAGEQHLTRTANCWTIVRSNFFAESPAHEIQMSLGTHTLVGLGGESVGYVSRDDVAAVAASIFASESH
jgi:NAD(P)H dehydrogenase (quinone)